MFDFKGNIGVFEFWIPIVFYHFAFYVTGFLPENLFEVVVSFYIIGYLIASISSGVRRLHDIDFSGFWIFLGFLPVLNVVLTMMWLLPSSVVKENCCIE